MKDKIKKIENSLVEIKDTLKSLNLYVQKIENEINDLSQLESLPIQEKDLAIQNSVKKTPLIKRVSDEEDSESIATSYTIQVVGLGTTKVDF